MIETFLNLEGDIEFTSDGDFQMNDDNTNFQDFISDLRCNLGSDVFDTGYGIPNQDLSQFARVKATDNLIEAYVREKAVKYSVQIVSFELLFRQPIYTFKITYRNDLFAEQEEIISMPF